MRKSIVSAAIPDDMKAAIDEIATDKNLTRSTVIHLLLDYAVVEYMKATKKYKGVRVGDRYELEESPADVCG